MAQRNEKKNGSAAGRIPPQDLDAERYVLSALLLDNSAIHTVYMEIKPESERIHRQQLWEDQNVPLRPLPEPPPGMLRQG